MIWHQGPVLTFLSATVAFIGLRLCLLCFIPKHDGVDHWYWRLYARTVNSKGKFPPRLPQYLLDDHQWYPPVFPLILTVLERWMSNGLSRWVAVFIDLLRLWLVLGFALVKGWGSVETLAFIGMVYATTPCLAAYHTQLNPRGLGALFLDAALFLYLGTMNSASIGVWVVLSLLGGGVLLTHKMTTQAFIFLCVVGAIVGGDTRLAILLPCSAGAALLLSGGHYRNVAKAHWDILKFWGREWPWLQSHPVLDSPIYGQPEKGSSSRMFLPGLKGLLRHLRYLFAYNPAAWVLVGATVGYGLEGLTALLGKVTLFILLLSLSTVFVPAFRVLGSGYLYLHNTAATTALAFGLLASKETTFFTGAAWLAIVLNAGVLVFYMARLRRQGRKKSEKSLDHLLAFLRTLPSGRIWCFPLNLSDWVACETDHGVLWGGHGYGFNNLTPIYPRLLSPVDEICRLHRINYILAEDNYCPEFFLERFPAGRVTHINGFRVIQLEEGNSR